MRTNRKPQEPVYQFYVAEIDTHVLVENHEDGVVLRASSGRFSERRKSFFIHHLAAEGYIPNCYQWIANSEPDGYSGLKWIVDYSWMRLPPELALRTTKFMSRLFIGAGVLCLTMAMLVFLRTP
jgi:hypothetical protein